MNTSPSPSILFFTSPISSKSGHQYERLDHSSFRDKLLEIPKIEKTNDYCYYTLPAVSSFIEGDLENGSAKHNIASRRCRYVRGHSGIIGFDIDFKDNVGLVEKYHAQNLFDFVRDRFEVFDLLKYVSIMYATRSGGVHLFIKVDSKIKDLAVDDAKRKHLQIYEYFGQTLRANADIKIDLKCKDLARGFFAYKNEEDTIYFNDSPSEFCVDPEVEDELEVQRKIFKSKKITRESFIDHAEYIKNVLSENGWCVHSYDINNRRYLVSCGGLTKGYLNCPQDQEPFFKCYSGGGDGLINGFNGSGISNDCYNYYDLIKLGFAEKKNHEGDKKFELTDEMFKKSGMFALAAVIASLPFVKDVNSHAIYFVHNEKFVDYSKDYSSTDLLHFINYQYGVPITKLMNSFFKTHFEIIVSFLKKFEDSKILKSTASIVYINIDNEKIIEVTKNAYVVLDCQDKKFEGKYFVKKDNEEGQKYLSDIDNEEGYFERFIKRTLIGKKDVSNLDEKQKNILNDFKFCVGYLLRGKPKVNTQNNKAILFCDGETSGGNSRNGGRGKTLISFAINYLRRSNLINMGGIKNINENKFIFSSINNSTEIVTLDEFSGDITNLYSEFSSGKVTRNGKFEKPYDIQTNFILTANTLPKKLLDESTKRRLDIVYFSPYYNSKNTPSKDLFGNDSIKMFDDDFSQAEWNRFYTFMFECVKFYLENVGGYEFSIRSNEDLVKIENLQQEVIKEIVGNDIDMADMDSIDDRLVEMEKDNILIHFANISNNIKNNKDFAKYTSARIERGIKEAIKNLNDILESRKSEYSICLVEAIKDDGKVRRVGKGVISICYGDAGRAQIIKFIKENFDVLKNISKKNMQAHDDGLELSPPPF